jgi:hypothetical protein
MMPKRIPKMTDVIPDVGDARKGVAAFIFHAQAAEKQHRDDVATLSTGMALMCCAVLSHKSQRLSEINAARYIAELLINGQIKQAYKWMLLHDYDTGTRSRPGWVKYGRDSRDLGMLNEMERNETERRK